MASIISYIKENKYELIITFFIFTNLFPMQFPSFFYYIGLALIGYKMVNTKVYFNKGHSVNVSKNKMAYEVILAYYLHMPLLLAFFSYFLT